MDDTELKIKGWCKNYPSSRPPRFLNAFLLLFLYKEESHGYNLIEKLKKMGVKYETYEVGYVYKTLRNMEKEGIVESRWNVKEKGAAKRIYRITDAGKESLKKWSQTLGNIRDSITNFIKVYKALDELNK